MGTRGPAASGPELAFKLHGRPAHPADHGVVSSTKTTTPKLPNFSLEIHAPKHRVLNMGAKHGGRFRIPQVFHGLRRENVMSSYNV